MRVNYYRQFKGFVLYDAVKSINLLIFNKHYNVKENCCFDSSELAILTLNFHASKIGFVVDEVEIFGLFSKYPSFSIFFPLSLQL